MKREQVLAALLEQHDTGSMMGAELGVMQGRVFFHLLDKFPKLTMVGVDTWEPDPEYEDRDMPAIGRGVMERATQYAARALILHGDSTAKAQEVADGSLDFIFIDAKHDTDSVLADIDAWAPKVKRSGFIAGHDIDFGTVKAAVEQRFSRWTELPDDVWVSDRDAMDTEWPEPEGGFDTGGIGW